MSRAGFLPAAVLAILLCAGLWPGPGRAQDTAEVPVIDLGGVLGEGSEAGPPDAAPVAGTENLSLPDYDRSGAPAVPAETATPPGDILLPLQADRPGGGIVRLTGEMQSAAFSIDLPPGAAPRDLVVSYRVAINVLPEESELRISVNGTALPPVRPEAFEGFVPVSLPKDLLVAGRNSVTIGARHVHRIYCGPDATFAVWTEIDTDSSGVTVSLADLPADPSGLMLALRAQLAREGNIPVHLGEDPADRAMLEPLAARLAGLRDGMPVALRPASPWGLADAVPPLARITVLPGGFSAPEVRRGGDGATVLVMSALGDGAALDAVLPRPGPVPDTAALPPGTATPLSALGLRETESFNRYDERQVTFRMPDDWLILASQEAVLRLTYGFADGLAEGALMLVKVNDTTVRLLPLDRDGGRMQPPLDIGFPARLLNPGVNAITFVTIVPGDPPDLPCPPVAGALMTLDPASTLRVPPSPRMHLPDMAVALRGLQPGQILPPPGVPAGEESAAGPALAALAAALRPVENMPWRESVSLTVTDQTGLGRLMPALDGLGLTRRDLDALFPAQRAEAADGAEPPEAMAPGLVRRLFSGLGGTARALRKLAVPGDDPLPSWLRGRAAEALLVMPDAAAPGALWLVVGADTDPARLAGALSRARFEPGGPGGRLALFTPGGTWVSWQSTATPPRLDDPLTLANFRDVAGNYASWSPLYFGLALFGLTFLSVGLALIFVITTRGRRKR